MKTVVPSAEKEIMNKKVMISLPVGLLEAVDMIYKTEHFEDRSAFIRSIVRDYVAEYRRLNRVPRKPYQKRRK
jgi:metal-responsive CopG/Arc/MetJ family transcriptional regulator